MVMGTSTARRVTPSWSIAFDCHGAAARAGELFEGALKLIDDKAKPAGDRTRRWGKSFTGQRGTRAHGRRSLASWRDLINKRFRRMDAGQGRTCRVLFQRSALDASKGVVRQAGRCNRAQSALTRCWLRQAILSHAKPGPLRAHGYASSAGKDGKIQFGLTGDQEKQQLEETEEAVGNALKEPGPWPGPIPIA